MVTLETDFNVLKNLVGKDISFKQLEDTLFDLGMELDEVEDNTIKIDITPDRPDMVSPQGLARVLRAYFGLKNPEYKAHKSDYKVIIEKSVKDARPYTACAVIKNLKFDDEKIKEMIWVQEKLHATFGRNRKKAAIGIYPMEKIKFPIRFIGEDPDKIKFRPLEYPDKLTGNEILEKHPAGKEYKHLLEGMEKFPFFIDVDNQVLSMPPIINSHETGKVTEETTEVFIECSGFDFKALSQTLNIIVHMFQDMGGKIYSVNLVYPDKKITTPLLEKEKREIATKFIKKMIGIDLTAEECAKYLKKMMYDINKITKDSVKFKVPAFRTDIWHDVDITDDIVRGYGVNNIKYEFPEVATNGNVLYENKLKNQIIDLLVGLDFQEVITFGLTDKNDQYKKMNIKEDEYIKLGHAEEQSINMVRTWLLPELLKSLYYNRNVPLPHKIFEINYVILPDKSKDVLSKNILKLACLNSNTNSDFTAVKQVLVSVLEILGFKNYKFEESKHNSFIPGRVAKVIVNNKEIGIIGEIHPLVLTNWELVNPISGFEINIDKLYNLK